MFAVGGPAPGLETFTSADRGMSWTKANTTGVAPPDKDDLNVIYSNGRFVDMQIVWQNHSMKYCDNGGCGRRRTVTTKTSDDGVAWSDDASPLIVPDAADPPELQFYRSRPFYIAGTSRLAAHTLLYAPAPPQSVMGTACQDLDTHHDRLTPAVHRPHHRRKHDGSASRVTLRAWSLGSPARATATHCALSPIADGRHPSMCDGVAPNRFCHGPHLYEEWWVGPADGDAANTSGWRRSHRRTHAAPRDAFLMAQPVGFNDEMVWVGSTGRVYTLCVRPFGGEPAHFAPGPFVNVPVLDLLQTRARRLNPRVCVGGGTLFVACCFHARRCPVC